MFAGRKRIEMWASCGDDFFYGLEGEEKDLSLAAGFYERAAKKKHHYAAYMLGLCYELGGRDLRKDTKKAEEWYQKAAGLGSDYARERLATGKTFIPSPPEDENQEHTAEPSGEGSCPVTGGFDKENLSAEEMYKKGLECLDSKYFEKDYQKAENWLLKAAEQGSKEAAYPLALIYRNGYLGKSDYENAVFWYELAAAQENEYTHNAHYALADLYINGEAIEKDLEKGVFYLQKMADNGDEAAILQLESLSGFHSDPEKLFRAYMKGSEGRQQNFKKADYWFNKFFEKVFIDAMPEKNADSWITETLKDNYEKIYQENLRRFLAMIQDSLNESDYTEFIKLLDNAAKEDCEFAGIMLDYHNKEGRDLRRKYLEEGEFHLHQAAKADEAGNVGAAKKGYMESLYSFLPAKESIKTREYARKLKEKYAKRDENNFNLTQREKEIFNLLLTGTAPKEIAYNLKISSPTVNFHTTNLYRKLGIQSRTELFAKYGKSH